MSFESISQILRNWPDEIITDDSFEDNHCERLRIALKMRQENPSSVGSIDLAGLIRFVLRCESVSRNYVARLWVPIGDSWPSKELFREQGCITSSLTQPNFHIVEAREWSPSWLPASNPFRLVEEGKLVRIEKKVTSDPAVTDRFRITEYLSNAQRDVIRAVALSRQDSINVVVLPTGSGKSLVGLSAALFGPELGVSIFVVPTIALAYDQMHEAQKLCDGMRVDAWHSGLAEFEKKAIRKRIKAGQQRLLYVSPESVVGVLSASLTVVAKAGLLRGFIVDEAHMISQWGNSFRPEFQSMAGLWRQLRNICPKEKSFRTVLMTATLTDEAFESIATFYGPKEKIDVLASVHLRPEPQYFLQHCNSRNEQKNRVLEVIQNGPRPVIIYVTKRQLADEWYQCLLNKGYKRVARIHGNTTGDFRKQAIQKWRVNQVDIIVATSAFGLGMDKGDVRLVVHACVPETIDRFYQEVGRGGRDGYAAVSMLLWTDQDLETARGISNPNVITEELALERWKSLFDRKSERWDGDIFLADLRAMRPTIKWESPRNSEWNLKTILLLERTGALEIVNRPVPEIIQEEGETNSDFQVRQNNEVERYWSTCPIRLKRDDTLDPEFWASVVSDSRRQTLRHSRVNWSRMHQLLQGNECIESILSKIYQVDSIGIDVDIGQQGYPVYPPENLNWNISRNLSDLFITRGSKLLLVTYPSSIEQSRLIELTSKLVGQGIREFAIPKSIRNDSEWSIGLSELHRKAYPERFVCIRDLANDDPIGSGGWPLPCLTVLDMKTVGHTFPSDLFLVERPLHIVLLPEGLLDPRHTGRVIGDVQPPPMMNLSSFSNYLEL